MSPLGKVSYVLIKYDQEKLAFGNEVYDEIPSGGATEAGLSAAVTNTFDSLPLTILSNFISPQPRESFDPIEFT